MRSSLLALVVSLPLAPNACGPPPPPKPDPMAIAQARRVDALTEAVRRLQDEVSELRAQMRPARQVHRPALRYFDAPARLELGRIKFVAKPQARAKPRNLAEHVANRRGVVLAFWATWCKPCIADEELVHVGRLRDRLRAIDADLVSVAVDDLDAVRRHAKRDRWIYPVWQQDDAHLQMLPRTFVERAGLGLPLFVVLDEAGLAVAFHNAPLEPSVIDAIVRVVETGR